MGWSSGPPRMVEGEAELEEGEAAFDDDKSIDLERDLSYLDEKVQSVLGHFQKDFEGGVSAENLGAKFGGYGSFLPTYQRSPSIWSQPKSPQRVQTHICTKSPNSFHREDTAQNATAVPDAPSSQRNGNAVTSNGKMSQEMMVPSGDVSGRQDSLLASAQVPDKFPKRYQQATNRSLIPNDQKPLKFRIKVGSDKMTQKNAAIYSGLGLTSPSSSTGNSLGESDGILFGSRETPSGSLSSMVQMLTSVLVAGGLLVSPLHENFLNFTSNVPKEGKPGSTIKFKCSQPATPADDSTSQSRDKDAQRRKHTQDRKSEKLKESKAVEDDMQSRLKESSGAQMLQNKQCLSFDETEKRPSKSITNVGESPRDSAKAVETSREYETGSLSSKREVNKTVMKGRFLGNELVKDEFLKSISGQSSGKFERREANSSSLKLVEKNQTLSSQKDIPVDHNEGTRSKANTNSASFRGDTDTSESEKDFKYDVSHSIQRSNAKVPSIDQDELRTPDAAKKLASESRKNSKGAQVKGKVSLDSAQGRSRTGVPAAVNEKGVKRKAHKVSDGHKNLVEANSECRSKAADVLEDCFGDRPKGSNFDIVKEKTAHDRFKEKPSSKKFDNQVMWGTVLKDPPCGSLPSNTGATLGGEQATVAPFLIEEDWVCCDSCQKWRLLPYGTKPEHLPEKWLCRMLDWLPGMNRCDVSEEETTKALQALSQLPPPENQPGSQIHANKSAIGARPIDHHLVNQNNHSFNFDYMDNGRKKTHKAKEIAVPVSKAKSSQQDVKKMGSSNDRKQPFVGSNPSYKLSSQRPSKPEIAMKELLERQKQERGTGGDAKPKKKVKRESDQDDREQKRIKTKGTFDINNFQTSTPNNDRLGFGQNNISSVTSMKNNRKHSENDYSKDLKVDARNGLQTSARKSREDVPGLIDSESLDAVRKSNDKEIPSKKRKLKDWQNHSDALHGDGSHLDNKNVPVKEESSDCGSVKDKKLRVSQSDGKDPGRSKSTAELRRKDMKTRVLPSASKNVIDRNFDNTKQQNKYRVKITSQLTMEDLELLKKDLGCDPVSTAATSSSSKVSDSRKSRSSYQEMKGSPVESVSSSPMRMSNMNKPSPINGVLGFDAAKVGDFSTTRSPREFRAGSVNHISNRPGMAKKSRNSDLLKPESAYNHLPDSLETDAGDKFPGGSKVGVKPSILKGNSLDVHLWEGHSPYCTDIQASESSKDQIGKNQHNSQQKSWKASSFPKEKDGSYALNPGAALQMVSDPPNEAGGLNSKRGLRAETETVQSHDTACDVSNNDAKRTLFDQSGIKSAKANKNVNKRESRKLLDDSREDHMNPGEMERPDLKLGDSCRKDASALSQHGLVNDFGAQVSKNSSTEEDCRNGKSMVDRHSEYELEVVPSARKLASGIQNGNLLHVRAAHDVSICNDVPKVSKDLGCATTPRQVMGNSAPDRPLLRDTNGPSLLRKCASDQTIPLVLKEAENLRAYADQLKDSCFGFECNEAYFQAALKYLHGASLVENSSETNKSGELNPLQIYISTAKMCETCAHEYERLQEMAVAALAYKCVEVAYMRVIYCKTSSANRYLHDLQKGLQNAPQGESPSSSASDIDNLNNQAVVEKAPLSKSNGSHSGSHVIAPQTRPNFVRLLDFTKDVNSAMEASKKAQNALAAANHILEEAQNKEGIVAVKRVIDFSFQDLEEFVRLVRIAVESISRHGFGGSRD